MFGSSLRLTLRTLRRRLGYTFTSSLGLVIGLACACIVAVYVHHETSFDTFHPDADRVERVYRIRADDPGPNPYPRVTAMVGQRLQERVAGVEAVASLNAHNRPVYVRRSDEGSRSRPATERLRIERRRAFMVPVDDGFFEVFGGFEILRGTRGAAFRQPGDAVLTRQTAERLFGTIDVVGRRLQLSTESSNRPVLQRDRQREDLTVRAVVENPPSRSHLQFSVLYAIATDNFAPNWSGAHLYVKYTPGADRERVLAELLPTYDTLYPLASTGWAERFAPASEALTDIHLHSTTARTLSPRGNVRSLWVLAILAMVVLGVAGVNYTNLAAVTCATRSAEVGTRKALGAHRGQLARQFVGESILMTLLCAPLAIGLASALTPAFNVLMASDLALPLLSPVAWGGTLAGAVVLGGLASIYPAASVVGRSVPALFDGADFSRRRMSYTRRSLIVVQFALFVMLAIGAVVMQQQMTVLQSTDLGFDPHGLGEVENGAALVGDRTDTGREISASLALQQQLRTHPDVEAVSSGFSFLDDRPGRLEIERTGDASRPAFRATWSFMSPNAMDVTGMSLQAGTYLDRPPEERRTGVAVVNEVALEQLGCATSALNECALDTAFEGYENIPVVGVLAPVQLASMRYEAPPVVLVFYDQRDRPYRAWHRVFVRYRQDISPVEQREIVEAAWSSVAPDSPLQYEALTDRVAAFYEQGRQLRTLGLSLTGVALILVILGLLAMAAYLTRLRLKEIAIRKTMGATVTGLLVRLNREFVVLTGIALVLGSAGAYIGMSRWLDGFATRVAIDPLVFGGVGLVAMGLAVGAVTWQSLSAARIDPAAVLRSE